MQLKTEKVWVGEREFIVQELTCANRNIVIQLIGGAQLHNIIKKVMGLITPVKKEVPVKGDEDKSEENPKEAPKEEINLFTVLAKDSGLWEILVEAIVESLGGLSSIIVLSIKGGVNEKDHTYILDNLTMRQEVAILKVLLKLNEIPELIKNFQSLLDKARTLRGL